MDENNAVGQTYESIMRERCKMYLLRIKLEYIHYEALSADIAFYIKRIRTLKAAVKDCERMGTRLDIPGKTVYKLGTVTWKREIRDAKCSLEKSILRRKNHKKTIIRLIGERNLAYDKLNSPEK